MIGFNGARYNWEGFTGNAKYNEYHWENAVQAENVDFRKNILEWYILGSFLVIKQTETHTDIGTLVGWRTERMGFKFFVWCEEGKTVCVC